jgi:CheY-like chemotaxis protein
MTRVTAADILKVVPITRKTLWLWQKKYKFFPDPVKEAHPGGKGIVGYYPEWVEERCKKVYALQKKGYTISMIQDILQQEKENQSARKILIVDDEKKFSNLLKKFFEKNNFVIEVAFDGWDAGLKAAQFMPAIIILDIALPGINGMEVCKNLKENSKTANIKVIAISGDLRHSEKVILDAGAEIYFTKPVDFDTLLTVCNEFVGQGENS